MKGNIYEKDGIISDHLFNNKKYKALQFFFPFVFLGPKLYTLCTVVFMSGEKEVIIFKGNPRNKKVVLKIPIC